MTDSNRHSSNNTNKLSPQEHDNPFFLKADVQIIQINLVLKNCLSNSLLDSSVQIIQINLVLKNQLSTKRSFVRSSNNTNKLSPQEL